MNNLVKSLLHKLIFEILLDICFLEQKLKN